MSGPVFFTLHDQEGRTLYQDPSTQLWSMREAYLPPILTNIARFYIDPTATTAMMSSAYSNSQIGFICDRWYIGSTQDGLSAVQLLPTAACGQYSVLTGPGQYLLYLKILKTTPT